MAADKDFIDAMIRIGSTDQGISRVKGKVVPIADDYGTSWPKNCCALFQSALLNLAGISFGYEASAGRFAYKLGGQLGSRNWEHIPVGKQQPGDIGVCFDEDHSIPGADHVYFVVRALDGNEMLIADNQSPHPHLRCADGTQVEDHATTPTEYFLRAPGYVRPNPALAPAAANLFANAGVKIDIAAKAGTGSGGDQKAILDYAQNSSFLKYDWGQGQHQIAKGYTKGMALVYARVYCKLLAFAPEAIAMAVADRNDSKSDALSWYADAYDALGLDNSRNGAATLRNLFNLLIGLGVQESSGRYFCGRDPNANFIQSQSAEAGLFQTSYGARRASTYMQVVYDQYKNRNDFIEIFQEGVAQPDANNLRNWSTPDEDANQAAAGIAWQKHTKESPAFAAEYAALCLRYHRGEFGTIRDRIVEISAACDAYLKGVEKVISDKGITSI